MSIEFREEMENLSRVLGTGKKVNAIAEVESELESIFGYSGSQILLLESSNRYQVTVGDAVRRPGAFHTALFYLLGELGSSFVMKRINERIWGPSVSTEGAACTSS
jgi:hypothetical protein